MYLRQFHSTGAANDAVTHFAPELSDDDLALVGTSVTMASANVRTLLPHQENTSYNRTSAALVMSKVRIIEQQLINCDLGVIGT